MRAVHLYLHISLTLSQFLLFSFCNDFLHFKKIVMNRIVVHLTCRTQHERLLPFLSLFNLVESYLRIRRTNLFFQLIRLYQNAVYTMSLLLILLKNSLKTRLKIKNSVFLKEGAKRNNAESIFLCIFVIAIASMQFFFAPGRKCFAAAARTQRGIEHTTRRAELLERMQTLIFRTFQLTIAAVSKKNVGKIEILGE